MLVLLTGGTGWIGKDLGLELVRRGHKVRLLCRDPKKAQLEIPFPAECFPWRDENAPIPAPSLRGVEAVIHLLGEPVAEKRWTKQIKKKIWDSRVKSTEALCHALYSSESLEVFVSASGIGFYGDRGNEELNEFSERGKDYLAQVCVAWEEGLQKSELKARKINFRIGMVLGRNGGALRKMLPAFQLGIGGPIAGGQQWVSWIHKADLVAMLINGIENKKINGIYNAVSPEPVRQSEFTKIFAQVLGRPAFLPVPTLALQVLFGELASAIIASQKVMAQKILKTGFKFRFLGLKKALLDILDPEIKGEKEFASEQFIPAKVGEVSSAFIDAVHSETLTPKGPWLHTHKVESLGSGTLILDTVRYKGRKANRHVEKTFGLRRNRLQELFCERKK
jgi:uncharacterized protein (TIGR01777 family)